MGKSPPNGEGLDIRGIVEKINKATTQHEAMGPHGTTAALIRTSAGIDKGSPKPGQNLVGNLSFTQVVDIARVMGVKMGAGTLKAAAKEVLGTCGSCGVTVEGKAPKDIRAGVDRGEYDAYLHEGENPPADQGQPKAPPGKPRPPGPGDDTPGAVAVVTGSQKAKDRESE